MFKRYICVKQDELKDCGVASLLTIIKSYGGNISKEQLRVMTKISKDGVNAYNLIEAAKKIGFDAKGVKGNIEDIQKEKIILPCIAYVVINKSYQHYIVIHNINKKKKTIIVADPSIGIKKYSFDEFIKIWAGVLIILYPFKKIPQLENIKSIKIFLYDVFVSYKKELLLIFVFSLLITFFNIINSFYLKILIDNIILSNAFNNLYIITLIFIVLVILKCLIDLFRKNIALIVNHNIDFTIYTDLLKHIISLPYSYYKARTTGEIVSRINDLNSVKDIISKIFLTLFVDIILILLTSIFLYIINDTLFFISIILCSIYIIVIIIFNPLFEKYIFEIKNKEANVSSYLIEAINGFETIKGIKIENIINNNLERKYGTYLRENYNLNFLNNIQIFFKDLLNDIGILIILFIGSILVIKKEITLGTLLSYNALLIYFLGPVKNIAEMGSLIRYTKICLKRVLELYDVKPENLNSNQKELPFNVNGDIHFNHLNFSYNGVDNILKDINILVKKGEKVLIVGSSGNGKSTLLKLLRRYYSIKNNSIFINGIDINNYNLNDLRNNICYVSQNEILFTDSIYNNITLRKDYNYDTFLKVCKLMYVDKIYRNNPLTFDMLIEENGFNISGGEKQRIILARTLMNNSNIYLLDESLNEINIELERKILINMFEILNNKIVLLVSHRMNNSDLFDKIIHMENGMIKKIVCKTTDRGDANDK